MACPLVAGCAAVVRETRVKNGDPTPSAALIKAILINGAVNFTGQYSPTEARAAPNNDTGWGRVNLVGLVIIPSRGRPDAGGGDMPPLKKGDPPVEITVPIRADPPPRGEEDAVPVEVGSGIRTLKVTLVWTDPPEMDGELQNDLDLVLVVVASDSRERFGNMGLSTTGRDSVNNVEQVVWENIPAGDVQIVVRPTDVRMGPQPWTYVWRITW